MMTTEEIHRMLQRFYDGTTTRDEERALRDWFVAGPCPADLQADREVVLSMFSLAETEMPVGLQERIVSSLHRCRRTRQRRVRRWLAMTGIAASVAAVIGGLWWWQMPTPTVYADTCDTPQEAVYEVHSTLSHLSADLCQGLDAEESLGGPCP